MNHSGPSQALLTSTKPALHRYQLESTENSQFTSSFMLVSDDNDSDELLSKTLINIKISQQNENSTKAKNKKINVKWNIVLYSYLSEEGLVRVVDSCALIVAESSPSIIITSDRAPERCSLRPAAALPPPRRPRAPRISSASRPPRPRAPRTASAPHAACPLVCTVHL